MRCWYAIIVVTVIGFLSNNLCAQDSARITYVAFRQFHVPFNPPNDPENSIAKIELYSSTNQGSNWELATSALPTERAFPTYHPRAEGIYWFAVRVLLRTGKAIPEDRNQLKPILRVVVDWTSPTVQLQALPSRGGEVGVAWEVRDENFDPSTPDSLRLEYRQAGSTGWKPVIVPSPSTRQLFWKPDAAGNFDVRLIAKDKANNSNFAITNVSASNSITTGIDKPAFQPAFPGANPGTNPGGGLPVGGGMPAPNFPGGAGIQNPQSGAGRFPQDFNRTESPGSPTLAERHFVNSKLVYLNYDLENVGPSQVKKLQLWGTSNVARSWQMLREIDYEPGPQKLSFDVTDEGLYGVTVIARSGAGLGLQPPQPGEKPQKWIEVDLTKPTVRVDRVQVDKGKITVYWAASDNKYLHAQPIRLYYAPPSPDVANRRWTPMVPDRLANNGSYTWQLPVNVPYEFYVKVEAVDLAGNVGEASTQDIVNVDLAIPTAKIKAVEGAQNP